ncbi:MAG: YCF48-related protein, partial [Bacillota bacterium]|nr:YCF48-related protein [Bacillota bacterium]
WKKVNELKVTHPTNYAGFLSENNGITVGYGGEIHYSTDGGKTWPQSQNTSMCRFGMDWVTDSLVWSCGNAGNIRVSKDGGKTWSAVTDCPKPCRFISFIDDKTGWVADGDWIVSTSDGGKTWNPINLPEGARTINAVGALSASEGFILDNGGLLYYTSDSGKTWSKSDLDLKGLNLIDGAIMDLPAACAQIRFTDKNNGTVIFCGLTTGKDGLVWVLNTSDAGKTWSNKTLNVGKENSSATVFLSHDKKYITLYNSVNTISVYKDEN